MLIKFRNYLDEGYIYINHDKILSVLSVNTTTGNKTMLCFSTFKDDYIIVSEPLDVVLRKISNGQATEAEDEWVLVAEQPPEVETFCWVATSNGGITLCFRPAGDMRKQWKSCFGYFYDPKDIIAWKPLKMPNPYNG